MPWPPSTQLTQILPPIPPTAETTAAISKERLTPSCEEIIRLHLDRLLGIRPREWCQQRLIMVTIKSKLIVRRRKAGVQAPSGPLTGHPTTRGQNGEVYAITYFQTQRIEQLAQGGAKNADEIAAILNNASPDVLNAIISKLAQDGMLDEVLGIFVLSVDLAFGSAELEAVYENFAKNLDANNLANISASMDGIFKYVSPFEGRGMMFAEAIANYTPSDIKIEYVKIMSDRGLIDGVVDDAHDTKFGALATAYILSTMKDFPENAASVLGQLDNGEMRSVIYAAAGRRCPEAYLSRDVLEATANVSDVSLKSRMFIAAGLTINDANHIGVDASSVKERKAYILQGMTKILKSDTSGVMRFLSLTNNSPVSQEARRTAFVAYAREMFSSGQNEVLAEELKNLLGTAASPGADESAFAKWLYAPEPAAGGGTAYPNAEMLGFFMGGLAAGAEGLKGDPRMINSIIALVAAKVPVVAWIAYWTDPLVDNGSDKWQAFGRNLEANIFVTPPDQYADAAAEGAYHSAYDRAVG